MTTTSAMNAGAPPAPGLPSAPGAPTAPGGPLTPVVRLRGVTKEYAGVSVPSTASISPSGKENCSASSVRPDPASRRCCTSSALWTGRAAGTVEIAGHDIASLSDRRLSALRARRIGFVFQAFHLVPGVGALENVAEGSCTPASPAHGGARWPPRRWPGWASPTG